MRSPANWLWLRSITATAMSLRASRSSWRKLGFDRLASRRASARPLNHQPRVRAKAEIAIRTRPATPNMEIQNRGRMGANETVKFMLLPQPFQQGRNMNLVGLV